MTESAAINGIGKVSSITPLTLNGASKKGDNCQSFKNFRSWTVPRTVVKLACRKLKLINWCYLILDEKLACEGPLIERPVLQNVQGYSRTLFNNSRALLDVTACSHIGNPTASYQGGHMKKHHSCSYQPNYFFKNLLISVTFAKNSFKCQLLRFQDGKFSFRIL